jgi:hypothetical protein
MRPFSLKVYKVISRWGKLKRVLIHDDSFSYPEQMIAEVSKWDQTQYAVITFGPDLNVWHDDRVEFEPLPEARPGVDAHGPHTVGDRVIPF